MCLNRNFGLIFGLVVSGIGYSAGASTPVLQYGLIQNVQNYSSNPFYNPNSYNVGAAKMVYNSGPSLKPSDCQYAVQQVIDTICSQRNYCKNTTLATIRPEAMVMLSKLPTYNFSSSCAGYIDTIYADYMKQNRANYTKTNTGFPAATGTATKNTVNTTIPKWQAEYNERASELKSLQAQTKTTTDTVSATDFPTTFNDLSFSEKNDIKRQGYEPYKDAQPYVPLRIIPDDQKKQTAQTTVVEKQVVEDPGGETDGAGQGTTDPTVTRNSTSASLMSITQDYSPTQHSDKEFACINRNRPDCNNDDCFCYRYKKKDKFSDYFQSRCFQADPDYCQTYTTVCILGSETDWTGDKHGYTLVGKRRCAYAYATTKGGDDTWYNHASDQYWTIPDCTDAQKWNKNESINKTSEVLVYFGKAIVDENEKPMEYFVKAYDKATKPRICIGYYCQTSDGKYQEPGANGTCK